MPGRAKLVLLDAGAVFAALEHDAWGVLTTGYEVVVPSIVLQEVQFYYSRGTRRKIYVDTNEWIDAGQIRRYEASAAEVAETITLINVPDGPEIHAGEAEALTYLRLEVDPSSSEVAFVSADGAAIQATALLDLSHTAKSLADVLRDIGYSKPLPAQYQREFVERHVQRGFERRLRK